MSRLPRGVPLLFILAVATVFGDSGHPELLQRIHFGSCVLQSRAQPIFATIAEANPDLFIFLGDNIYADTTDMEVMQQKYDELAASLAFQRLLESCPVLAVWDDHDYGADDAGFELLFPASRLSPSSADGNPGPTSPLKSSGSSI